MRELAYLFRPFNWDAIAESLPEEIENIAKIYGHEKVIAAGFKANGFPASWIDDPISRNLLFEELEKDQ